MDLQTLINAGLPATSIWTDFEGFNQYDFSRPLTSDEWHKFLELTSPAKARKNMAKSNAKMATTIKSLTPKQAVDYIEKNVTNIATAKTVMKVMARMLISMRDEIWPDLPEEE